MGKSEVTTATRRPEDMRRCDRGIIRTVLLAVPIVISVIMACLILPAVFMPSGELIILDEREPLSAELDGSMVSLSGTYEVTSRLPYDIDDLSIRILLVDEERGSRLTLWESEGMHIPSNGSVTVEVGSRFFAPTLVLILRDSMDRTDSSMDLRVDASFGYLMGLTRISVGSDLGIPVSTEGSKVEYGLERGSDSHATLHVDNLRDQFVPDDSVYTITDGSSWIRVETVSHGNGAKITFTSDTDLERAVDSLKRNVGNTVILDSASSDTGLPAGDVDSVLTLMDLMLEGM